MKFFTTKEVTYTKKILDFDLIEAYIESWLRDNKVNDQNCILLGFEFEADMDVIRVRLAHYMDYQEPVEFDEDFVDDKDWDLFCISLAEMCKVRRVAVPLYYWGK